MPPALLARGTRDRDSIGLFVEVDEVGTFPFDLLVFKIEVELLGNLAALVDQKVIQLLCAVLDQFVDQEQQVGFVSEELAGHVLVFAGVHDASVAHRRQDCFDQVLETLIDQSLLLFRKFGGPLVFREVVVEILFHFHRDKLPCFQESLVHRLEVHHEQEYVQWTIVQVG